MDDRKLLELAAKAAGVNLEPRIEGKKPCRLLEHESHEGYVSVLWNPLTDDGDALRLAVALRLQVQVNEAAIVVKTWQSDIGETKEIVEYFDQHDDVYAVARRAIVRAGATKCST